MVGADHLGNEVARVATDPVHVGDVVKAKAVRPTTLSRTVVAHAALSERSHRKSAGTGRWRSHLGLGQEERRAAFHIAKINVIAQGGADDAAIGGDREHHFRLRIVPVDIGCSPASMPAPIAAIGCALEKISASGPMADRETLAPHV
jgi:hypothetical protein